MRGNFYNYERWEKPPVRPVLVSKKEKQYHIGITLHKVRPNQHGGTYCGEKIEQDFIDNEIAKRKDLIVMKSSNSTKNYSGSDTIVLVK